jgi:hypothetical protein
MAVIGRLPRRLPVGTRYVLEGVPSEEGRLRVISRLLVLPSGEEIDLTDEVLQPKPRRSHGPNGDGAPSTEGGVQACAGSGPNTGFQNPAVQPATAQ